MQSHNFITFIKNMFFLQLFFIVIIAGVGIDFAAVKLGQPEKIGYYIWRAAIPNLNISTETAVNLLALNSVALAGQNNNTTELVAHMGLGIPQNLMAANLNIPITQIEPAGLPDLTADSKDLVLNLPWGSDKKSNFEGKYFDSLQDYQVFLYCTHSSESYISAGGEERRDGEKGLISQVADEIAEKLELGGIQAQFVDRIHDYPDYDKSYTASRETVKDIVNSQKKLVALFDIHRDHIPGEDSAETVNIEGQMAARILIIAGTDERKEHPHWEENLDFAERIYQQGEKMYPGLIKGVRTRPGTYNQEFFNHALLMELGTDLNSLAEASYAGELFARIVLEVLEEEINR